MTMFDQFGTAVQRIRFYADSYLWSKFADGYNYSLVARPEYYQKLATLDATSNAIFAQYWRQSANVMGSPFADDPPEPTHRKIRVTFSFVSYEKNWVQFYNPTGSPIDISGWVITDKPDSGILPDNTHAYAIPSGVVIHPLMISTKIKLDFTLNRDRDLYLAMVNSTNQFPIGNFIAFRPADNEIAYKRSETE